MPSYHVVERTSEIGIHVSRRLNRGTRSCITRLLHSRQARDEGGSAGCSIQRMSHRRIPRQKGQANGRAKPHLGANTGDEAEAKEL